MRALARRIGIEPSTSLLNERDGLGLRDSTNRLKAHWGPVSKYPTVGIPTTATNDLTLFLPAKPFTPVLTRSGERLDLTTARRISILRVCGFSIGPNVWIREISGRSRCGGWRIDSVERVFKKRKGIKEDGGDLKREEGHG